MKLLVDADFLIALAKKDDSNHDRALKKAAGLKDAPVVITPFAIPEATTVLSYKVSQKAARRFLEEARKRNFTEVFLDQEIIKEADELFLSQDKKGTSWVDCLNVSVIKSYQLDGILSFDKFYRRLGIKMV